MSKVKDCHNCRNKGSSTDLEPCHSCDITLEVPDKWEPVTDSDVFITEEMMQSAYVEAMKKSESFIPRSDELNKLLKADH